MKYLPFFLLLSITAYSVHGQNQTHKNSKSDFRRVQIGINISPDVCFRNLKNNDNRVLSAYLINLRNDMEVAKLGYTAGLNICYNINRFIGLETGIQYANRGYQTKKLDITPDPGQPSNSFPEQAKFIYNYYYADIPLKLNITVGQKKLRYCASIGLTTNVFLKEKEQIILFYSKSTTKSSSITDIDYKKINISPTFSIGIDYKINSRMNLRVEPTFRYGARKIIEAPITAYLYSGGLNIGYNFGL